MEQRLRCHVIESLLISIHRFHSVFEDHLIQNTGICLISKAVQYKSSTASILAVWCRFYYAGIDMEPFHWIWKVMSHEMKMHMAALSHQPMQSSFVLVNMILIKIDTGNHWSVRVRFSTLRFIHSVSIKLFPFAVEIRYVLTCAN